MTKYEPTAGRSRPPDFGRAGAEHVTQFLGIMTILHSEAVGPAFGRLLRKKLEPDDYVQLAHVFEEISVLALHHLIPEALLYDAFAFDLYWDEVREDVIRTRQATANEKFCENFELAAERARDYRADRPPKHRWMGHHEDGPDDEPGGGGGGEEPPRPPEQPSRPSPQGEPAPSRGRQ
jgi:hypothetical protein